MKHAFYTLVSTCFLMGVGLTVAWAQQPQPKAVQAPAKGAQTPVAKTAPAATTKASPAPVSRGGIGKPEDEAAIKAMLLEYAKHYNAGQADALASLMTDDVEMVDGDGNITRGRKDVSAQFAAVFTEGAPATLKAKVENLRFVTPDVAQVSGQFQLGDENSPLDAGRFSVLTARREGRWQIAELRDYPLVNDDVSSNYEQLKDLEWMVGEWVNEGGDAKITSSIRWVLNKNYLVRDYTIAMTGEPTTTGTMYIGWDAQAKQVQSWVFDSEGGHGQAHWTRVSDTEWVVKARGSLRDGSSTSATQVITLVNKDLVKQSSLDRIIGGALAADINEVLMVRKPNAPGR